MATGEHAASGDKNRYSLKHFPPDLLMGLGLPVAIVAYVANLILSIHGAAWIWTAAISCSIALIGSALLFIAKLPLYRQRRLFTFGIQAIPESRRGVYRWGWRCSIGGCAMMFVLWLGFLFLEKSSKGTRPLFTAGDSAYP